MLWLVGDETNIIQLGPFLDATDGVTPETGLAGTMTVRLSKNGGAFEDRNSEEEITHSENGYYSVELDNTDCNTPGTLLIAVTDGSTHLPVFLNCMVINLEQYKALVEGSVIYGVPVDVRFWRGTAVPSPHAAGYPIVTVKDGTGTGEIDTASGKVSVAAGGIAAASFAAGAIDAAALATDAANEIRDAVKAMVVESQGSYTLQQALSIILAALAGVTSSGGDVIATPNGSATRITATLDGSGNRTAMTLNPSS